MAVAYKGLISLICVLAIPGKSHPCDLLALYQDSTKDCFFFWKNKLNLNKNLML